MILSGVISFYKTLFALLPQVKPIMPGFSSASRAPFWIRGFFDEKNEPLNTLSEYRRGEANHKDDVYFGVNVIVQGLGGTFKAGGVCEVMV